MANPGTDAVVYPATPTLPDTNATGVTPRFWLRSDYLLWFIKKAPVPVPLVTTGPFDPNLIVQPVPAVGAIGNPTTKVLYGGQAADLGTFSGMRFEGGFAVDEQGIFALEGGGFLLERRSSSFMTSSDAAGNPRLTLPFNDITGPGESAVAISRADNDPAVNNGFYFGGLAGKISVNSNSRLWGWEANASAYVYSAGGLRMTALAGFRYLDLDENLVISSSSTPLDVPMFAGFQGADVYFQDVVSTSDVFHTRNHFYGAQVGGRAEYTVGNLTASVLAKVAVGGTQQRVSIAGNSSIVYQGVAMASVPGGVYAVASNSGVQHGSDFSVVPEVGVNVGYQVNDWLRAQVGYTFLYWSSVVRPGDQIDRNIDGRQIPLLSQQPVTGMPAMQPIPRFERTDFWVQGVNFSLLVTF